MYDIKSIVRGAQHIRIMDMFNRKELWHGLAAEIPEEYTREEKYYKMDVVAVEAKGDTLIITVDCY